MNYAFGIIKNYYIHVLCFWIVLCKCWSLKEYINKLIATFDLTIFQIEQVFGDSWRLVENCKITSKNIFLRKNN